MKWFVYLNKYNLVIHILCWSSWLWSVTSNPRLMSLMVILKALNLLHMTALRAFISVLFTGFCCCSGWQIELPWVSAQSEVCAKKTESWSSRCCVYLLVLIEADCFDAKTKLTISNGPTFISLNHCIYIVYQFVPSRI